MPVKFVNFLKSKLFFSILLYCISQKVKNLFVWNLQHIIFKWKRRYWHIFKSALEYLYDEDVNSQCNIYCVTVLLVWLLEVLTLFPFLVLIFPFVVLVYLLVVLVCQLVVLVCHLVRLSICLSTRSTRLSTRSARSTICRPFYNWSFGITVMWIQ